MSIKTILAKPYANIIHKRIQKFAKNAVSDQLEWQKQLVKDAKGTKFGRDHHFQDINSYHDFKQAVPIRDYEGIKDYIELIKEGTQNVLWKGKPLYFAKTSGTTSGTKYIPITKSSIGNHINTAKYALLNYMVESGNTSWADGNMIFLSGSPTLERVGGIPTGRLSGIVNHHVPNYLRRNQLPSYTTNCIEDWEEKLGKIVEETLGKNMTLISGIPPWMQMYFDWMLEKTGSNSIKEIYPQLQLLVHGGVNFAPYKDKLLRSVGGAVHTLETYPASEGFFAFQDKLDNEGLLLNSHSGIFFEFVPTDEIFNEHPTRYSLQEVEIGRNYALIINSNAGLWGYNIGDTVKFISTNPYRIVVTGRIKHFISAFGEHVIGEEVDKAIRTVASQYQVAITEYTVAPLVNNPNGLPYHEWFIEAENLPKDYDAFALALDNAMRTQNVYYDDLIRGSILQPLKINWMRPNTFVDYMKSIGRLGGQNKLPRLSNDRKIAEALLPYFLK